MSQITFPHISQIVHEVKAIPAYNASGGARAEGDVMFWKVQTDPLHEQVETCSAANFWAPAGIVPAGGFPDQENWWLYRQGELDVKVLGSAGLSAGDVLQPVAGQLYLADAGAQTHPGRVWFRILEDYTTASVALKKVLVDLMG